MAFKKLLLNTKELFYILSFTNKVERLKLILIIFLGILGGIFEIGTIALLMPLIGTFISSDISTISEYSQLLLKVLYVEDIADLRIKLSFLFIITSVIGAFLRSYTLYLNGIISAEIGVSITDKAYISSLRKPYIFYLRNGTSKLVSNFTQKPGEVCVSLMNILSIACSLFILIGIFSTLLWINPQIAILIFIGLFISYWILNSISIKKVKSNSYEMNYKADRGLKKIQESFDSIRDILIDNTQEFFRKEVKELNYSVRIRYAENSFFGNFPKLLIEPIALIVIIFLILIESNFNNLTVINIIPAFGSIIFGLQKMLPQMQLIYANYTSLISILNYVKDVVSLIDNNDDYIKDSKEKEIKSLEFNNYIVFKNVSYAYTNNRDYVLEDINIKIRKGSKVGLIGKSGSGKSTIIDLVIGLVEPSKGVIYIDNLTLDSNQNTNHIARWQKNISHVPQDVVLHDLSIAENIALGKDLKEIDLNLVNKCIKSVQLQNFIKSLPNGIWTKAGERGVLFSGGQCQRVGIARALYKNKDILILDEATNRLDVETEKNLIDSIFEDNKQTIIVISHRLSNLKKCDKVYKIEDKMIRDLDELI